MMKDCIILKLNKSIYLIMPQFENDLDSYYRIRQCEYSKLRK